MIWFLLACSSEWSPDTAPIEVQAWAPTLDAPGLVDQPLHLRLNARIDSSSLDSVELWDSQERLVDVQVFADSVLPTLTITPAQPLEPDSVYTLALQVGLVGLGGQLLQGPIDIPIATLGDFDSVADTGQ